MICSLLFEVELFNNTNSLILLLNVTDSLYLNIRKKNPTSTESCKIYLYYHYHYHLLFISSLVCAQ